MGSRTKLVFAALLAACMVATIGCNRGRSRGGGGGGGGTDGGGGGTDSGSPPTEDGGTTERDSGPVIRLDSGPTTECDTDRPCPTGYTCQDGECVPTAECTFDSDCPAGEECVSGSCEPVSPPTCRTNSVASYPGSPCASATLTCWEGCADSACVQSCLDSDPNSAACNDCVNQNLISCANSMGCQDEWNCFNQCWEDNGCTDRTCVETYCSSEDDAYSTCVNGLGSSACASHIRACFP